jgi:hypothetical protein
LFISSTLSSLFAQQIVESTDEVIKIVGNGDSTKELFPLKMRDAAQAAGFAYIKSKGLIPEEDSDDYIPVSATARGWSARGGGDTKRLTQVVAGMRRMQGGGVGVVSVLYHHLHHTVPIKMRSTWGWC